eukprot:GHVU01061804.1.p1 GENE.GHVU01061804.1~~GHVU01061804.1.p1  ORF type:complete len:251 (+),score=33.14 GHVU01061804.1:101-754(+)
MRVAEGSLKSLEDTLRLLSRDEKDRVRELELLAHGYHVEAGGGSSLQSLATAGRDSSSRLLPVGGQVMTPRSVRGRPGSNRAAVMRPNCSNNSMWEDASGSTTALAAASGSARHHSRARLRPFVFGEQANDSPLQPFRVLHKVSSTDYIYIHTRMYICAYVRTQLRTYVLLSLQEAFALPWRINRDSLTMIGWSRHVNSRTAGNESDSGHDDDDDDR